MPLGAKVLVSLVLMVIVAGCQQPAPAQPSTASEAPPTPQSTPVKSMEDWDAALADAYEVSSVTDEGDGVSSFIACHVEEGENKNCAISRRDAFRKLRFFAFGFSSSLSFNSEPKLKIYISLPDGQAPALFLSPVFVGDSWIFVNKVAVMIDGEVVLEQEIDHGSVEREVFPNSEVEEVANFIANNRQIEALRAINKDSEVMIRVTGSRGYVSIAESNISNFKSEIPLALAFYDRLNAKLMPNLVNKANR